MNKNRYKIIYNKHRVQMMTVTENATQHSKSTTKQCNNNGIISTLFARIPLLTSAILLGFGFCVVVETTSIAAEIHADPSAPKNQQPTILQSANGTPQINIRTPSKKGVSINQYWQMDIDQKSAILNNSRKSTRTQQAGWIQGNPWLANGEARITVNQINSTNPCQLNDYLEVAVGCDQKANRTLTLPIGSTQITPFYATVSMDGVSELTLSEPYKKQTNTFNQQEIAFSVKGEHFGSSSVSPNSHYYEIGHFNYQDHTFKLIIYNKFGESDTPLLNTQLNSYDKQGNLIDAVLLDSRFNYEDIVCFSNFSINPDYSIHIENYVTYLYKKGQYGSQEGLIKDPKPQLYLQMQYKIENGMFKQVAKIGVPTK